MLVLSRKLGETIVVGEGITISVVRIRGGRVQLGISAPDHVSIERDDARSQPKPARSPRSRPPAIPR